MTTAPRDRAAHAQIEIAERLPTHQDAVGLLHAFYREQVARYGFADPIDMSPGEYAGPDGLFVVAYKGAPQSAAEAIDGLTARPARSRSRRPMSFQRRGDAGP